MGCGERKKGYSHKADETFAEILCESRSLRGFVFSIFGVPWWSVNYLAWWNGEEAEVGWAGSGCETSGGELKGG